MRRVEARGDALLAHGGSEEPFAARGDGNAQVQPKAEVLVPAIAVHLRADVREDFKVDVVGLVVFAAEDRLLQGQALAVLRGDIAQAASEGVHVQVQHRGAVGLKRRLVLRKLVQRVVDGVDMGGGFGKLALRLNNVIQKHTA